MLVQKKPVVYQEIAGQRVAREGKFKLYGHRTQPVFGFEVAAYDRKHPLVIDPVLLYSTYLGGSGFDAGTWYCPGRRRQYLCDRHHHVYGFSLAKSLSGPPGEHL